MSATADIAPTPEIVALIDRTLREAMWAFGLSDITVRAGEDHDGDPVLLIDVDYELSDTPLDVGVAAAQTTKLRDRLWAAGERRFPHIRHRFPEGQKVKPRHGRRG